jgi:hypothetical protein
MFAHAMAMVVIAAAALMAESQSADTHRFSAFF